jgi:histidine ammonia-lyase
MGNFARKPQGRGHQGYESRQRVSLVIDGTQLDVHQVAAVAREQQTVEVAESAWAGIEASRAVVDKIVAAGEVAYGITTGFGEFAHVSIDAGQVETLQRNLIMSHAVGVGEPLPAEVVRAMMLIRVNTLVKGFSGVRRVLIERLVALLNGGVLPMIPSRGSVGASGDLAPLAHMALPIVGLGRVSYEGVEMLASEALAKIGLEPLPLAAKEGLALINGTQLMAAIGSLTVVDAENLVLDAQIVGAMSLEALMGSMAPLDARVHELRPHVGQGIVAANMRKLTTGSSIMESHAHCSRVQDAYSLRCMPQVLGACRDLIKRARHVIEIELNSVNDNPIVFPNGDIISQGNFHGEPLAFVLDGLSVGLAEIASISERRIERMVNPDLSEGLRPFLVESGGLNSGYMIAQYVAAALVSENKIYAHPASVDSIPTSANQEDHVSMGSIAALKLAPVLSNVRSVVAIEAMCAAQGLDFKGDEGLQAGPGGVAAHAEVRKHVKRLEGDRILSDDVRALEIMLQGGLLRKAIVSAGLKLR